MQFELALPDDFSFTETINAHGWRQLPPFRWRQDDAALDRVERLESGRLISMSIRLSGQTLIIDTSTDEFEQELTDVATRILQLDLPMDGFHRYCHNIDKLRQVPALKQGRMLVCPTVFEDVVKVICTTNTTWAQTKGMVARLCEHFGCALPEDSSRHAFPAPEQICAASFDEFAEKSRLGYRAKAAYTLACDIESAHTNLELLRNPALSSEDLWKKLLLIRGIGPYGAACLMIYLGRYDRVNVDSWARTMVGKELGRPVTDKEVHAFFEPYGQWRALVYHFYPWREEPPAY